MKQLNINQDKLDDLAILRLQLLEKLVKTKRLMEESMKSGYFMLGKTRYVLGNNAVSQLQLPGKEKEISAICLTESTEESLPDFNGDVKYNSVRILRKSPIINVPLEEESTDSAVDGDTKPEGVRLRKGVNPEEKEIEEEVDQDVVKTKTVNIDPIRWFTALPPQTLRQAQVHFRSSLDLGAECVTLHRQIDALNQEYTLIRGMVKLNLNEE